MQFSLRTLLGFTTGLCLLFAILAALGMGPGDILTALAVFSALGLLMAAAAEGLLRLTGERQRVEEEHQRLERWQLLFWNKWRAQREHTSLVIGEDSPEAAAPKEASASEVASAKTPASAGENSAGENSAGATTSDPSSARLAAPRNAAPRNDDRV